LEIARQIGDKQGEGNAYGNLGNAYSRLGDYPKAIEYHQKNLEIARQIGDKQGEGNAYGNLGNAYSRLGDYPKAIEQAIKGSLILLQIQSPNIRQVLNILTGVCQKIGVAAFEELVKTSCGALGVDYSQYRPILEQGGVFEGVKLNDYQKSLVRVFSFAALGNPQAIKEVEQWVTERKEHKDWAKLAGVVALLLAGERDQAVLLDPSRGLDEIDTAIMEQVLATLHSQLEQTGEDQIQTASKIQPNAEPAAPEKEKEKNPKKKSWWKKW